MLWNAENYRGKYTKQIKTALISYLKKTKQGAVHGKNGCDDDDGDEGDEAKDF